MNWDMLKTLCRLCGTSGRETAVRDYILTELRQIGLPADAVRVDRLGNVLVHKQGASPANRRVLFAAHMDEVALMITDIHADGSLAFDAVGGVNASAVIGRQVQVGTDLIPGVIGCKPVHLLSADMKKKPADMDSLYCDIGTRSKAESEALVQRGDIIYFADHAQDFGEGSFTAKAIDDRFGCAVLLSLLAQDLPYDTEFAFTVQEEVGLRGAGVAARTIDPEIAVVFEATTAADIPGSETAQ